MVSIRKLKKLATSVVLTCYAELRSYLGYFTMIWFTWFQNTMFDVRFSNDSVFERICKALQFGVMTGFAITGPGYQTGLEPGSDEALLAISSFRTLSFILMASRLILSFQYCIALWWLKDYKKARLPMIGHILIMFTSAMIFLGLSFAFNERQSEDVLAGWYVTFVLESVLVNVISGRTPFLSFRSTVLIERLGLLTLIILGEGVISMSNALNSVGTDNWYGPPIIGQIICCVVITYLMYMLYFDNVQPGRMGNRRSHLWAILHFPLHASIVLVEEGQAQLAIWQKVLDVSGPLVAAANAITSRPTPEQISSLNDTLNGVEDRFLTLKTTSASRFATLPNQTDHFSILSDAASSLDAILNATAAIEGDALHFICDKFNIDVPDDHMGVEAMNDISDLYKVVYVYFFAFAGLVLINLSILFVVGKRKKLRGELLAALLRFMAGLGLSLLATMAAPSLQNPVDESQSNLGRYLYSGTLLPTVLIVYLLGKLPSSLFLLSLSEPKQTIGDEMNTNSDSIVLVLDNLLIRYVKSVVDWRKHLHHHRNMPEVERPDYAAKDISHSSPHVNGVVSEKQKEKERPQSPKSPTKVSAQEAEGSGSGSDI